QGDQTTAPKFSNAESHRVGTDIDRGKDGHVYQAERTSAQIDRTARGGFLSRECTRAKSLFTAEVASECRALRTVLASRTRAEFARSENRFSALSVSSCQSCQSPIASWADLSSRMNSFCSVDSSASSAI